MAFFPQGSNETKVVTSPKFPKSDKSDGEKVSSLMVRALRDNWD